MANWTFSYAEKSREGVFFAFKMLLTIISLQEQSKLLIKKISEIFHYFSRIKVYYRHSQLSNRKFVS